MYKDVILWHQQSKVVETAIKRAEFLCYWSLDGINSK